MYAIVEIAGLQYKVEQDQQLYVNRLKGEAGDVVAFDRVLLTDNGSVTVGAPVIDGLSVQAKILEHVKGDKVIVFKKKRRKGYKKKNGHRQQFTKIEIVSIGAGKAPKKKEEKKEEVKKAEVKDSKPKKETPVKEAPAKKTPSKETAPKKAAKKDDLKKIEGIGPKAAEALVNSGVDTFVKLTKKSVDEIKEILVSFNSNLAHLDPETWGQQADLAANEKWEELEKLQDELKGGRVE